MNAREKEFLALCAIWEKALDEGEISITLPSRNEAIRFRFQLYGAGKRVKQNPEARPKTFRALEECSIRITPHPGGVKAILTLYPRRVGDAVADAMVQLGIEDNFRSDDELAAERSLEQLTQKTERAGNKYFNREDE